MIEMERPKITHEVEGNKGTFVIGPLERGYGITLGNAMRRILLNSLPGAAVTKVQIDGVINEFSTIPGVVEDVTEIILNLKRLAIRIHDEDAHRIAINIEGPKEVKAGDIVAFQDVEICNPDLHIATLEKGAKLEAWMEVEKGRGYVPAEQHDKNSLPVGTILVDSIFTPVKKVNFTVEDTRVKQRTDYDKLTLEIETDGSITPFEGVAIGAKIMFEHLNLFIDLDSNVDDLKFIVEPEEKTVSKELDKEIEKLGLSVRSRNCLHRAHINTVKDLTEKTRDDMMKVRNLGQKSLVEIEKKLEELGLSLKAFDED